MVGEMKETDIIFSPTFIASKFNILASMRICVSPILRPFVPSWLQLPLTGFDGVGNEKLLLVSMELLKKIRG
jgi:hypothetical protein